jgi:hypothetical protein
MGSTYEEPILFIRKLYAEDTVELVLVASSNTVGGFLLGRTHDHSGGGDQNGTYGDEVVQTFGRSSTEEARFG